MKDFEGIEKSEVWKLAQSGKAVYAVVFEHDRCTNGVYCITKEKSNWNIYEINRLLKGENVAFFKEKEDKK